MNREPFDRDQPAHLGLPSTARNGLSSNKKLAACHQCRDRKTRCVGFPVCQYCAKNNLLCSRSDDQPATPLDHWGQRIIDAIHNAKQDSISTTATSPLHFTPSQRSQSVPESSGLGLHSWSSLGRPLLHASASTSESSIITTSAIISHNPEAILTWPIWRLPPKEASLLLSECSPSVESKPNDSISTSASTSLRDLKRWQSNYVHCFLGSYPIVDVAHLRRLMTTTAEKGPGWNSSTCLFLLTCALGAQCRADGHALEHSKDIAQRYWNMAQRRLGWALDDDSVVSTQCFALAGLWHLHAFEPYKARKMLFLATCRARPFASSAPSAVLTVCSTLSFKVAVGLGLPVQPTNNTDKSLLCEPLNFSRLSNVGNPNHSTTGEGNYSYSIHEACRSLELIYSQCLQFNTQIPSNSPWQSLLLIFNQLSDLSLQLDRWCNDLPESLQLLSANFVLNDTGQNSPPLPSTERGHGEEELHVIILYREVKIMLLLPALFFVLSPNLSQRLSTSACPPSLAQQLLDRITMEANMCLRLAIRGIHEASTNTYRLNPSIEPNAANTSPLSQSFEHNMDIDTTVAPCDHVQKWLISSCAFRYGPLLLAGLRAYTEARENMPSDLVLCAALHVPDDSKTMLKSLAGALLEYPESTDLWYSGRLLERLCQDVMVSANTYSP